MSTTRSQPARDSVPLRVEHLQETISAWTGIPLTRLTNGEGSGGDFSKLKDELSGRIFGQEAAIASAVAALERRFQLPQRPDSRHPKWRAICAGSSGVGKSELARQLAVYFFGDDRAVIQVDCSELDQDHHLARLVGSPPGYIGHDHGGQLTNAMRSRREAVLLFDEVEKAHPTIINKVLLPLLGEGVVHDMNDGRALDASNMLVILTSNLGCSRRAENPAGFHPNESATGNPAAAVRAAIEEHFPREVLGRIDDIIIFEPLGVEALHRIWRREMKSVEERLDGRGTPARLELDEETEEMMLGHIKKRVEQEGARAVVRFFDQTVVDPLLKLLKPGTMGTPVIRIERTEEGGVRYSIVS